MTIDEFNIKNGHTQRYGFTTGTTATAAAIAAAYMYLDDKKDIVDVELPAGITLSIPIEYYKEQNNFFICGVKKNAGDDPDVTDGILISAKLEFIKKENDLEFNFFAGEGVGIFTKDGLALPKGEAAINPVPRQMMIDNLSRILKEAGFKGTVNITVMVENGVEIAKKTFNERLGIIGGISILGTSGLVLPMSKTALLETIEADIKFRLNNSKERRVYLAPGNIGAKFLEKNFNINSTTVAIISNFIGESIDYSISNDAREIVLCGDLGKLIKLSGGIMNTHSNDSDSRLELLVSSVLKLCIKENIQLPIQVISNIFEQKTTTGAVNIIKDNNFDNCFNILANQMLYYAYNRAFKAEIFYHKNRYANIEEFKNNLAIRIIVFSDNIMIIDTGENNE
ncbi:cobalt-precorrin-5B (C(1))-methyltransferase CbiD [Lachnoanaerobaculum gingivalis]|jgi:cobalamin biosynthesis protein cbiD|uniref:Cobalt-precorrin-5B C(1)-methyltransferase n=1 Tax=Lachnoanaerobaculum gingivalis TaxID=2490855 RepID=A0A3P3QXJ8_9FIRM|nr:cobalt-precorrin-5B (C(1))-methyltransferase CbiD [Lachnoanaerobaculum gingivalis]RRJ25977.1 cobalamin biosynthesis protein CbiD [Lachnoanaerobaculum gingivalis]WHE88550.1 cobalt-precorrin-5B (C(1))-methyltransferase CbiD [Lachnoanaerobaculum gingivalis]